MHETTRAMLAAIANAKPYELAELFARESPMSEPLTQWVAAGCPDREDEAADSNKLLRLNLRDLIVDWRKSATALQGEVDDRVAKRQSLESKRSRIQVLNSAADRVEGLL